jgi:hypothetical protein
MDPEPLIAEHAAWAIKQIEKRAEARAKNDFCFSTV